MFSSYNTTFVVFTILVLLNLENAGNLRFKCFVTRFHFLYFVCACIINEFERVKCKLCQNLL